MKEEPTIEDLIAYMADDFVSKASEVIRNVQPILDELRRAWDDIDCRPPSNMEIVRANQYNIQCAWEYYFEK